MNIKLNTMCFIILLFLLIGVASATNADNETLQQTIEQPDDEFCQMSSDNQDELKASDETSQKLENSNLNENKLEATVNNAPVLETSKTVAAKLTATKTQVNLKATNVKMHYNDGSKLVITLKNKAKKAIAKAKIKIKINDKTYTKTTNSKGKASLTLKLDVGKYTATITYGGSNKYYSKIVKSTITVKTTIKSDGLTKYYTNNAHYFSTFYDKKGKLLRNTNVKLNLNGETHTVKTNNNGVAKLVIDLKPGIYGITSINPKTSQTLTKTITIKTILETNDLTMNEKDGGKFTVKVLNCYGKASPNKSVTLKVNGQTYTPISNSQGIATQIIELPAGKYSITTEYEGLIHTNQIIVEKNLIQSKFSHVSLIPDHVNVTAPYVFTNSKYAVKTGPDGIIKLPKNEVFAVHISETKHHVFSTLPIPDVDSITLDRKSYLVPFDGSDVKSDYNKDNLKDEGILISKITDFTQIEFRSSTQLDADMFGLTFDKHRDDIEIITYIQNDLIKARILFYTAGFDELGLKSNLGKLYDKNTYEINYDNYDKLTNNNADKIRFVDTNQTVQYSESKSSILPVVSQEDIITKLIVNGHEELEKEESITYGRSDLYQPMRGFEVLQSFALVNDRITKQTLEKWLKVSSSYLTRLGIMNIYGMFLSSLETAWLADEIADEYEGEFNVNWKRGSTATILGGINLNDTYMHILNADMGMKVTGDSENVKLFRFINSIYLPNLEDFALEPAANRFENHTMNSLDNVISSIASNRYSITQLGELIYVFDGNDSAIVLNTTSGVSDVIISNGISTYKGSVISTKDDCCSICQLANDIVNGVKNTVNNFKSGSEKLTNMFKSHPLSMMAYHGIKAILGKVVSGVPSVALGLFNTMAMVQTVGVTYRTGTVEEKDWHGVMDTYTFTRSGYLQGKKVYNIPNNNGGNDYIEVPIKTDLTLDRNNAKYISHGQTKTLTEQETYQYFTEDYWTPFSMPTKYWDKSFKLNN